MRRNQYRTHAIAIGSISVVITVLFFVMQPPKIAPQPDSSQVMGDRYITIYSATWGENCNQFIEQAAANPQPLKTTAQGEIIPQQLPNRIVPDNVLQAVSNACNGKLTCRVTVNSATLGVEPLGTCFKELKLSYRCYTLDRLWPITLRQNDVLNIDCNEKEDNKTPNAGKPAPIPHFKS